MTNVTNATNIYQQYVAVDQLSGGLISIFLLSSIFFLIFIIYKQYEEDTKSVLLVDSVIISILAVLMWAAELISWKIVVFPIIMIFASMMVYKFS